MRITILTWQYPPRRCGGTEIATQNLAKHLALRGHEISVITTRDEGLPPMENEGAVMVHRVQSLAPKALKYLWFCLSAVRLVRRARPDIVHAQALWMTLPALMCGAFLRLPYVVWLRGSDVYDPRVFKGGLGRLGLSRAAQVLALTEHMKEAAALLWKRDILVVPNGVDSERFGDVSREEARRRLSIDNGPRIVLFVGSLTPVKGVKYLIEAMRLAVDRVPEAQLMLVGDGPQEPMLRALSVELGLERHIVFVSRVPNEVVPQYMAAADVFVLPSLSEGFPLVVLEAMAAGLPIVCSDVRGLKEIVEDGANGYVVPPRDPDALARRILFLLAEPEVRKAMSVLNRRKAEVFTWGHVVDKVEDVHRSTIPSASGCGDCR